MANIELSVANIALSVANIELSVVNPREILNKTSSIKYKFINCKNYTSNVNKQLCQHQQGFHIHSFIQLAKHLFSLIAGSIF